MENNQEKFKVWWDGGERIIRTWNSSVLDDNTAGRMKEEVTKLLELKGKLSILVDLNQCTEVSSGARKTLSELSEHPNIIRIAFAGASMFMRAIANIITTAGGQNNAKHFATEEAALTWLKEK